MFNLQYNFRIVKKMFCFVCSQVHESDVVEGLGGDIQELELLTETQLASGGNEIQTNSDGSIKVMQPVFYTYVSESNS